MECFQRVLLSGKYQTADAYNVKINKCYYNVPEDLINKLSDIITEQKEN